MEVATAMAVAPQPQSVLPPATAIAIATATATATDSADALDDALKDSQLSVEDAANKENEGTIVAPEFLIKHPLQNVWTLWFFEHIKGTDWGEGQKEITSIDTVEDFWSIYNHIKLASELKVGCDYSLFKQGISPMWEDPRNENGGRWLLTLEKRHHRPGDIIDKFWLDVCLCLVGEVFKHADEICGSVVNIRGKQDKLSLWTLDCSKSSNLMDIGKDFKEKLQINRFQIQYITHKDQKKSGSTTKTLCTL
ncbi:eukaryotic translation initiation factor 4E1 [Arctopsyche grandis]|uniref:eukaryotic translation initiation factor 4E1 n=1 Tax=Arctopsyche grandis TaxID=121162 RepID=UPI00406D71D4